MGRAEIHASPTAFIISIAIALLLSIALGGLRLFVTHRGVAENLQRRRTRSVTDRRGGPLGRCCSFRNALALSWSPAAGLWFAPIANYILIFLKPDHV